MERFRRTRGDSTRKNYLKKRLSLYPKGKPNAKNCKLLHSSLPNLTNVELQELHEYNAPGTLTIQSTMEDDEDLLMTDNEVQFRSNQNENRQQEFCSPNNNSYNSMTTQGSTTPVPLENSPRWNSKAGVEGYDTVNGDCAERSIYPHHRLGSHGQDLYNCSETKFISSQRTENGVRPLTFTQAKYELDNIESDFSKVNANLQRGNGVKSAESFLDGDEISAELDDPHLRFERSYEAEINELTKALERTQLKTQYLTSALDTMSHRQSEIIRRLQLLQQNRKTGYRRSPFRAPHAQPEPAPIGVNQFSPFSYMSRSRPESARYQNYLYTQPHPPIAHSQYVSGSLDSIDTLSRNSLLTQDDDDQTHDQMQSMLNHHYMHNPQAMKPFVTDGSGVPFIPENEKPKTPRSKYGKHSNKRYSMNDSTQMGSRLVSPTSYLEGYPEHLIQKKTVRSPENMKASQRFEPRCIYLHPTRPLPQASFVTQNFKPPNDSFNVGTSDQSRNSFHISQTEAPGMGQFSHISRSDILRRKSGSQQLRPYSQDRWSFEHSTQDVRRRSEVSQIQKRRDSHVKNRILQDELHATNNISGPEFSLEGNAPLNQRNFKTSTDQTNHDSQTLRSKSNFKDNNKPASIETTMKIMTSEPNEPFVHTKSIDSPRSRRARSIIGSRMVPPFDPLSEHSEEDLPSISVNSCAGGASIKQEVVTSGSSVITLRDPSNSNEATQIGSNSFSVNNKEQSPESGKLKEKHIADPLHHEETKQASERNLLASLTASVSAKQFLELEDAHLGGTPRESSAVGKQVVDDVLRDTSRNCGLTTTKISGQDPKLVPIEVRSPIDSLEEGTFIQQHSHQTIDVPKAVRHLCLGPLNGYNLEFHQNSPRCGETSRNSPIATPPSWIGVCYGNCNVAVYDLKTLSCIVRCEDHMCFSRSPVVAVLPFVSQDIPMRSGDLSKISPGLLCVVQEDGNITLYDLENERVCGRTSIQEQIAFAFMLPQTKVIPKSLIQLVLSITASGEVICFQWNLVRYLKERENKRLPEWEAEIHDMGVNVFDRLKDNGSKVPYVCCVAPQQQPKSNPGTGSCSPRSPMTSEKELATGNFSLVAAFLLSSNDLGETIVRLCRWVKNSFQLKLSVSIDKELSCESDCKLVGITYAEIGGAASICLCMNTYVFWFSFRSADLITRIKLPLCAQPTNLIPSIWPHKCLGSSVTSKPNERLWAAVGGRNVLELSAVNSQRRSDNSGRGCLALLHVYPSDSTITALTSVKYEDEVVIAGTDKGQIHVITVQNTCYICQIPDCVLGFFLKEDLINHLVHDHYYTDCSATSEESVICTWPNCDIMNEKSNEGTDHTFALKHAEKHAMQHASEQ